MDQLPDYLHLQKAARAYGIDAAYTSWREQRLAQHLIETLWQWLDAILDGMQAFVSTRSDELLYPGAWPSSTRRAIRIPRTLDSDCTVACSPMPARRALMTPTTCSTMATASRL